MKELFGILIFIALGSCATKVDVEPMVETPEIQQQYTVEVHLMLYRVGIKELQKMIKHLFIWNCTAPDLQLSVDIATIFKTVLADRINGKLDSMTKQFIAKTGTSDIDFKF